MLGFKRSPATDPTALLNLLCKFGWITDKQKEEALSKKRDRMIGETLIDLGFVEQAHIDQALIQQKAARGQLKQGDIAKLAVEQMTKLQAQTTEATRVLEETAKSAKIAPIERSKPSGDDT